MGITVLYSSGDYGVAGYGGWCTWSGNNSGVFIPSFPSTCLDLSITPCIIVQSYYTGGCPTSRVWALRKCALAQQYAAQCSHHICTHTSYSVRVKDPETACESVIYSGGGFSNHFRRPSYQKDAVAHYLKKYPPPYPSWQFNASSRAFPGISANG